MLMFGQALMQENKTKQNMKQKSLSLRDNFPVRKRNIYENKINVLWQWLMCPPNTMVFQVLNESAWIGK